MTDKRARKLAVFAVIRVELDVAQPELGVAVKEILPTVEEAEAEVQRLNRLNAGKRCLYLSRATRYFPDGLHPKAKS